MAGEIGVAVGTTTVEVEIVTVAVGSIGSVGATTAVGVWVGISKLMVGSNVWVGSGLTPGVPQAVRDSSAIRVKSLHTFMGSPF